LRKTL